MPTAKQVTTLEGPTKREMVVWCPICNHANTEIVSPKTHSGKLTCHDCGSILAWKEGPQS